MNKLNVLFCLLLFSGIAVSEGLSGIPSHISGEKRTEGKAIGDVGGGASSVTNYLKNTVATDFDFVRPAKDARSGVETSEKVSKTTQKATDGVVESNEEVIEESALWAAGSGVVDYVLPDGYKEVSISPDGKAQINADRPGTHLIRAPILMYSVFTFPFTPNYETIFPDAIKINIEDGVVMVASKRNIPINIVFFHPEKPSLALSIVLVPDSSVIPAQIDVKFAKNKIPEVVRENEKSGVVVDGHRIAKIKKRDITNISEYEKGDVHIEMMKKINTDMAKGYVPDGYGLNIISEGPTGVMCGDKRLLGRYTQNLVGELFEIDVFEVKNAGSEYVKFDSSKCYRSGVATVQFNPSPLIRPGNKAELIIVHTRTPVELSDRTKRPMDLRGRVQ